MSKMSELHAELAEDYPPDDEAFILWCDQESEPKPERPTIESVQCMALREAKKDDSFIGLLERRLKR